MGQRRGYKQTETHKKRISKAHKKGNYFNCFICNKRFWRKPYAIKKGDNKFCSKNCYFEWQKNRPRSEAFKQKCKNRKLERNGNWKGGITPINKKIRQSEEFFVWRKLVFKRDNYTCQKCNIKSKKGHYVRIEAHHIKPFAMFPELRFVISNGITLCKKCHLQEHKGKKINKLNITKFVMTEYMQINYYVLLDVLNIV